MLQLEDVAPVKIIVAALWNNDADWRQAVGLLSEHWGHVDEQHSACKFSATDYYQPEMGKSIQRQLLAFENLTDPAALPDLKLTTNQLEEDFSRGGSRTVNLDVGYLDLHKLVLASTKEGPQKIYMGKGIWADLTLLYRKGGFHPLPWTFPDFSDHLYDNFLLRTRARYKKQRK